MEKNYGNKTILIIESDDSLRSVLQIALRLKGATLYLTESVESAKTLVERMSGKRPVDVILYDLALPFLSSETSILALQELCMTRLGNKPVLWKPHSDTPSLLDLHSLQKSVVTFLS
jgi:DNA-binding NtrC family response regulator